MKNEEKKINIKEKTETESKKSRELNDEGLKQVTGGSQGTVKWFKPESNDNNFIQPDEETDNPFQHFHSHLPKDSENAQ